MHRMRLSINTCCCMIVSIVSLSAWNLRDCFEPMALSLLFAGEEKTDNWDNDVVALILYSNQSKWETSSVNTRIRYSFDRIYCFRAYYSRWVYPLSTHTPLIESKCASACSPTWKCMNQIRIMIDGEVTRQATHLHRTSPWFAYVKRNEWTRSLIKARRAREKENQHDENKLISLARLHKMIAASHNTPSLFPSERLSNDIDRTNLTGSCAFIALCNEQRTAKQKQTCIGRSKTNLIDRSIDISATLVSSRLILILISDRSR